ncbi:Negative regulator of mitotic exit, partial [Rhizopus stolonifer]
PMSPTHQPQQRPLMNAVQNEVEGQRQPFQAPSSNQPPVRPPRHISTVPEAALRRPRATSPLPQNELDMSGLHRPYPTASPTSPISIENELMRASPIQPSMLAATEDAQHPMRSSPHGTAPPPRPPREGVGLRSVMADMSQIPSRNQSVPTTLAPEEEQSVPERSPSRSPVNKPALALEEKQALMREIQARDLAISEMKKKENWWRTEVSLARKQQANKSFDDGPDADEVLLMDVDHLPEDKVKLFEQLVSVKSELRRVKASILQQAQPMSDKVSQADRMRTAALQEAAYFKSKYLALKSRRQQDLAQIEGSRCDELEKRLANALVENEANAKLLQQLQKRSQYDQHARTATEERAREAQERAEEAQQAHQRALEELQMVYARATKAEMQVRDNALKIADLTQQLSEALLAPPSTMSQEATEAQLKASQLEAANLRARNETASLKQKLAEQMDDIDRLRASLSEREDALAEAKRHVEDYEIQLNIMRDAMNQQQQNTVNGGFSSTRAY